MSKSKKSINELMTPVDYAYYQLKFARDSLYRAQESFIDCANYSSHIARKRAFQNYYNLSTNLIRETNILFQRLARIRRGG